MQAPDLPGGIQRQSDIQDHCFIRLSNIIAVLPVLPLKMADKKWRIKPILHHVGVDQRAFYDPLFAADFNRYKPIVLRTAVLFPLRVLFLGRSPA